MAGKNVTTASFTPPVGALLVAFAWHDTAGGNLTGTSVVTDSQGLTWTVRATRSKQNDGAGAANSHIQISTAVVASSVAMTVTSTGTNTNNPAGLYVRVIAGADTTTPMDATPVEGTTTAAVVSTTITTVTDGARCFLQVIDWNFAAAMTAGSSQTGVVIDTIGSSPDDRIYLGVTNAVTSPAGSQALSTGSPSTGNTNNWIGIAVRPAVGGGGTQNATGSLTATAALTAAATSDKPATSSLTVTAAGTAAAASTKPVAAAVTAAAALTAAATSTKPVDAALAVTATRTAVAASAKPVDAALTVTATLTAAAAIGAASVAIAAAPTFTATLTAAAAGTRPGTSTVAVTAALTAAAVSTKPVQAALAVTAVLMATAAVVSGSSGIPGQAHGPLPQAPGGVTYHAVSLAGSLGG